MDAQLKLRCNLIVLALSYIHVQILVSIKFEQIILICSLLFYLVNINKSRKSYYLLLISLFIENLSSSIDWLLELSAC